MAAINLCLAAESCLKSGLIAINFVSLEAPNAMHNELELDCQAGDMCSGILGNWMNCEFDRVANALLPNGANLSALHLKPVSLLSVDSTQSQPSGLPL